MASNTFHYFRLLPFDVRREIYLLATPPRLVHVQEHAQPKEEFLQHFKQSLNIPNLNPDIAYFAPNWRGFIDPGPFTQRTLESFGITSSRGGPHQPWEPSPSTPEIPLHWLHDQPEVASQIMRENSLYSTAPIPPLLHAWKEPRNVLINSGYTLAFETRRSGPRTWFHFERDILFVKKSEQGVIGEKSKGSESEASDSSNDAEYYDYLLTNCLWSILGQFHSRDLKRVRKLALGPLGEFMCPHHCDILFAPALKLVPHLKELQIVQWQEDDLLDWCNRGNNLTALHPWYTDPGINELTGELYSLPVEDIDALLPFLSYFDGIRSEMPTTPYGNLGEPLMNYQMANYTGIGFFEHCEFVLEDSLDEEREISRQHDLETEPGLSTFSWDIPFVKFVHALPPSMAFLLQQERQVAWTKFIKMKQGWDTAAEHALRALPSDNMAPPGLLTLNNSQGFDGPYLNIHVVPYAKYQSMRKWWAEKGTITPPSLKALF